MPAAVSSWVVVGVGLSTKKILWPSSHDTNQSETSAGRNSLRPAPPFCLLVEEQRHLCVPTSQRRSSSPAVQDHVIQQSRFSSSLKSV